MSGIQSFQAVIDKEVIIIMCGLSALLVDGQEQLPLVYADFAVVF